MGNTPRKGLRQKGGLRGLHVGVSMDNLTTAGGPGRHHKDRHHHHQVVRPRDGDVLYPASDILQTSEATLNALRECIGRDSETFLLDNLLMAMQYFENYEKEASALRQDLDQAKKAVRADTRGTPLALHGTPLPFRELQADGLATAAARHVRWRTKRREPDERVTASRRLVLHDNVFVHADDEEAPTRHRLNQYHLAVEPGHKPGFVKLRRVRGAGQGAGGDVSADDLVDGMSSSPTALYPPRRAGTPSSATTTTTTVSSSGTPAPRLARSRSQRTTSKSSDASSTSGLSTSSEYSYEKHVPLDKFRSGGAVASLNAVPDGCFQAVLRKNSLFDDPELDEDDDDLLPSELRVDWYLMAAPLAVRFADAFHDHLAAALGVQRESVVLATVRASGLAAIRFDQFEGTKADEAVARRCEVALALQLPGWPTAAAEWVFRERAGWPSQATLRAVCALGGVAVPVQDLRDVRWALAFPAGERLLELSLPGPQAHAFFTLQAVLRDVPGLSDDLLRALFLRQCEQGVGWLGGPADSNRSWLPGRALRHTLTTLYTALQQRYLPDYFVSERNLLAEMPTRLLRRAQERVFRLREQLVPHVLQTCRRIAYNDEDNFYPRLDLAKLTGLLCDATGGGGSDLDSSSSSHSSRKSGLNVNLDWVEDYRSRVEEERVREAQAALQSKQLRGPKVFRTRLGSHSPDDKQRTASILKLFCEHFIGMGEASIRFGVNEQAWLYFRQSLHLSKLLEQDYDCAQYSSNFVGRVRTAERRLMQSAMTKLYSRNTMMYASLGSLS